MRKASSASSSKSLLASGFYLLLWVNLSCVHSFSLSNNAILNMNLHPSLSKAAATHKMVCQSSRRRSTSSNGISSATSHHNSNPTTLFSFMGNQEDSNDDANKVNANTIQQHLNANEHTNANDNENNTLTSTILMTTTAAIATIACLLFHPSSALASSSSTITATEIASSTTTFLENLSQTGFYQAFSLVFVSEIGDKTFFIAGLLAMKAGRLISLIGSVSALAVMTIISVIIGQLFHAVPPGLSQGLPLDDVAAVLAFAFFGLKTLKEASEIKDGEEGEVSGMDEEFAEAEEAVEGSQTIREVTSWGKIISTFGLVFAAEFGDRSFLSTIALSAAQNPVSVAVGAIAAHAIATGIAVAGGSYVAKYISEKVIGYIGGSLFLVFAVTTALGLF